MLLFLPTEYSVHHLGNGEQWVLAWLRIQASQRALRVQGTGARPGALGRPSRGAVLSDVGSLSPLTPPLLFWCFSSFLDLSPAWPASSLLDPVPGACCVAAPTPPPHRGLAALGGGLMKARCRSAQLTLCCCGHSRGSSLEGQAVYLPLCSPSSCCGLLGTAGKQVPADGKQSKLPWCIIWGTARGCPR